mmetsp:Transcript_65583/g.75445  ORF Transcript_65583/g.75445 Transcript_65583/m.75445 type:complete len:553 (-) Transcript_65583:242-1900(-)
MDAEGTLQRSPSFWNNLVRKKDLTMFFNQKENDDEIIKAHSNLTRTLTTRDLVAYGIGGTLGAGAYSTIGFASQAAGPALCLSFLVDCVACIFTALAYAEFASKFPIAGGTYAFVHAAFGEFAGWLIGWTKLLSYSISASAVARGAAAYFNALLQYFGIALPGILMPQAVNAYIEFNIVAVLVIVALSAVGLLGTRNSANFNNFVTVFNVCFLSSIIIAGTFYIQDENWTPFFPKGFSGVFEGSGMVFFAFIGFDQVSVLAEECKNPRRDLPLGIIGCLVSCSVVYVSLALVTTGMVPLSILDSDAPIAEAFDYHNVGFALLIIAMGSLFGLTSSTFGSLYSQPRILYGMAKDGLLPKKFAEIDPHRKTMKYGIISTCVLAAVVAFPFTLEYLSNVISLGVLAAYTFTNGGVVTLRYAGRKKTTMIFGNLALFCSSLAFSFSLRLEAAPAIQITLSGLIILLLIGLVLYSSSQGYDYIPTTFKCPCVPLLPCLGICCNSFLMGSFTFYTWVGFGVWLTIGATIYFTYGYWNSELRENVLKEKLLASKGSESD